MATAVTDELKNELMSRGIWSDFVRIRADVKARGEAKTSRMQTLAALKELAPDLVERVRPRGRPRGAAPSNPVGGEAAGFPRETPKADSLADAKREAKDARRAVEGVKGTTAVSVRVSKDVFKGKSCTISQAFMWAYSNLCFADVTAEDAPSAVAWQMYVDMLTSPSLKADMLKSGLGAAMRKAEAEGETNGKFDGEGEYDLLAAIANGGGE